MGGWDTHRGNFQAVRSLSQQMDPAMAGLIHDLDERGRLDKTLILWMGEFGRTPRVNEFDGRDHYARAWSVALAGGGIAGGRVLGKTNATGMEAQDRPVSVQDLFATIYGQLGVDPSKKYLTPNGRPVKILEGGDPIKELLA